MARFTYKNGQWLNKDTGLAEEPSSKPWQGGAAFVVSDYAGYTCPITDTWVEGRAAHRENLKRHGCRVLEKGETRDAAKVRDRELDRACERAAGIMVSKYINYF